MHERRPTSVLMLAAPAPGQVCISALPPLAVGQEVEADELEWAAWLAFGLFMEEDRLFDALDCCLKHDEEMLDCAAQFAAVRRSRRLAPHAHTGRELDDGTCDCFHAAPPLCVTVFIVAFLSLRRVPLPVQRRFRPQSFRSRRCTRRSRQQTRRQRQWHAANPPTA